MWLETVFLCHRNLFINFFYIIVALGYNSAFFGPGTGLPILIDNLHCFGNESTLFECPFETHTADCSHAEDAGVKCYPGIITYT